jgi:glycerol-3-phosphate dehydrogenase
MPALTLIIADLVFCAQHEMVVHLEDLLRRRVPLLILSRMKPEELKRIFGIAAKSLVWDDNRIKEERELCRKMDWMEKSHES